MKFIFPGSLLAVLIFTVYNAGAQERTVFLDRAAMDTTVKPGNDFFEYANGTWLKETKIPDEFSSWGSFTMVYDENTKKLHALLDSLAQTPHAAASLEQKAGNFYKSGMDTVTINHLASAPLKPMLQQIAAVKNYKELLHLVAHAYTQGDGDLLGFYVGADEKNSAKNIAVFYQTGLTLPEKGYYTRTDSNAILLRKKLVALAARYFTLTGTPAATAQSWAQNILALETKIAAAHRTPVELRDPAKNYNKFSVAGAQALAPNLGWQHLFSIMGIGADSINIAQPEYFKTLSTLLATQPIAVWKQKLSFDYINSKADLLTSTFRNAKFAFDKEITGQKKMLERWKEVSALSEGSLKDVVGQLYVAAYFPPAAKRRMDTLVNNLQTAFRGRIQRVDWMTDSTREKAIAKLDAFIKKIGYPDTWKSYADVTIYPDSFFANMNAIAQHDFNERLAKIGKAVDKTEWLFMTPATVNAYYNPTYNEIVFPAGILQFPFFDMNADDAVNYGAIGGAIGHEMTHGFDDQGRQYDAAGNMQDWWQAADAAKFKTKADQVVAQYNGYPMLDTAHVNGALTLGENLADLGGVTIAYDAFKLTKQGQGNEMIDGFTPDQRFFLSWAQVWRVVRRPELTRTLLNTNPHAPEKYRVLGPLSNFEPFYKAFDVQPGDAMYRKPVDVVKVW